MQALLPTDSHAGAGLKEEEAMQRPYIVLLLAIIIHEEGRGRTRMVSKESSGGSRKMKLR